MRESTLWFLHLFAGAVMLVVLGIHFGVMHTSGLLGIDHSEVLSYSSVAYRSGKLFYLVVYMVLLVAALYHSLYGLRSLIFELTLVGPAAKRVINIILILCGWGFFFYGSYAIIAGFLG